MSRTLGGPLAAHLATASHTRAKMLRLDLLDGTSIGITTHDRPILFDVGDGAITYSPETGIMPGAISLSAGFDTDNYEVSGPIGDTVSLDAVLGGRFNRARARIFEVNWKSLGSGAIKYMAGNVGEIRPEGGKFVFSIRSDLDRYNQTVGRTLTPMCDADLGDARCTADFVSIDATVTAATDAMRFTVAFDDDYADDFFNAGQVTFATGALAGTQPMEIFDWGADGSLILFMSLADVPAIGATLTVKQGCPKTRTACRDIFGNVVNFRGFPEVPGSDQVLKSQVPGDAAA